MRGLASRPRRLASVISLVLASGCVHWGAIDDGSSLSLGQSNGGMLLEPARLELRGAAHVVPRQWANRGLVYGTDELVAVVHNAAAAVRLTHPGAQLRIADVSKRSGGRSAWHRSHQTGRDIDLLFYARTVEGNEVAFHNMVEFDERGVGTYRGSRVLFDVARNWTLVKSLVTNSVAEVQYMFIADWLRQRLLDHAIAAGEPRWLVLKAAAILRQPGDSLPHDDHIHLRLYCSAADRTVGCRDRGRIRWYKKSYKYSRRRGRDSLASRAILDIPLPFGRLGGGAGIRGL